MRNRLGEAVAEQQQENKQKAAGDNLTQDTEKDVKRDSSISRLAMMSVL